jgi:hypothetical protein
MSCYYSVTDNIFWGVRYIDHMRFILLELHQFVHCSSDGHLDRNSVVFCGNILAYSVSVKERS